MIDWKARFRNKAFIIIFAPFVISTIYQGLAIAGVTPGVEENTWQALLIQLINVLGAAGIIIDSSTPGISDRKATTESEG